MFLFRTMQPPRNNNPRADAPTNRPARPLQQEQIRPSHGHGVPKCNCNVDAKELTVKKDGPNKGRPFYRCGNQDNNCNFFAWKDEDSRTMNNTNNQRQDAPRNQSFPGRKRRNSDNDEDGKQRKCGLCKQAGHTRRNCPTLTL